VFFLLAVAIMLGSFAILFTLWFVIWSLTMSSSDAAKVLAEDRLSKLP
jgi:hypothetical protein